MEHYKYQGQLWSYKSTRKSYLIKNSEKNFLETLVILKSENKNLTNIKDLFQLKNIDINKIIVSNKVSFGKKGFK